MNYLAWSKEYIVTADELAKVIQRLKATRDKAKPAQKKELDRKLAHYRCCYRECMETATLLRQRHRDAA